MRVHDGRGGIGEQVFTVEVLAAGDGEIRGTKFNDRDGNGSRDGAPPELLGPIPYLSAADSPFDLQGLGTTFYLEDFEDHELTVPGVTVEGQNVFVTSQRHPLHEWDSVDGDDGDPTDGSCLGCDSIWADGPPGLTFRFDAAALGGLPSKAGFVWTDGEGITTFEAFGPHGEPLGIIGPVAIADGVTTGTTAEDRFFGVLYDRGISAIKASNTLGGIEIDHLQYGDIVAPATSLVVPGTSDLWLAGMPDGATASLGDTAPAQSPVEVTGIPIIPGDRLGFVALGDVSHGPSAAFEPPDGGLTESHHTGAENGIATLTAPINSLVGVFLGPDRPDSSPAPGSLDFSANGNVVEGTDYRVLSPLLKQPFYIGDGATEDGEQQQIVIPEGATRLLLGTMDGEGWYNNLGSFDVNVRILQPGSSVACRELLTNGTFETGNVGFSSGLEFDPDLLPDGRYTIGLDPVDHQPFAASFGDHTTGHGQMMIVNGATQEDVVVWERTVPVARDGQFTFSLWAASWHPGNSANLQVFINGEQIGNDFVVAHQAGDWQQFSAVWDPQSVTSAHISIVNTVTAFQGNDFALDDLSFCENLGLEDWIIYLDQNDNQRRDVGERFTVTDQHGNYAFRGLPDGDYIVREEMQPGWIQTAPLSGFHEVRLGESGGSNIATGVDFGNRSQGESTTFEVFGTGLDDGGNLLAAGTPDPHYVLTAAPAGPSSAFAQTPANDWIGNTGISQWIGPVGSAATLDEGLYIYETQFELIGLDPASAVITGMWASDNTAEIFLNGVSTGIQNTTEFLSLQEFTIDSGFVSGTNVLQFHVTNTTAVGTGFNPTGLQVQIVSAAAGELPSNANPFITSDPPTAATAGTLLRYDAIAIDADNDPITFDLALAPDGMAVHPTLGVLVWQPTNEQVGIHQIVLRVRDDRGGLNLQGFEIAVVLANTAPIVTSTPPMPAVADRPYRYAVRAQDAEDPGNDALNFRLDQSPAGMQIDETTGELTWTPTQDQIGSHPVTIIVRDNQGEEGTQSFILEAVATAANDPPRITSSPRLRTRLGAPYLSVVEAHDPNGDPLTYHLDDPPPGMTIDASGIIRWEPNANQLGGHPVHIRVEDGRGESDVQSFLLEVVADAPNTPPRIVSPPHLTGVSGRSYVYDARAEDPNDDPIQWSLVEAPRGMSIDPARGTIRWTPAADQLGPQQVVIQAQDVFFAAGTQSFVITVRPANLAPQITSPPIVEAAPETLSVYAVRAEDPDRDRVEFRLNQAPSGMEIDAEGVIRWTPTPEQAENSYPVTIVVEDEHGAIGSQSYTVHVSSGPPNRAPRITSTPPLQAAFDTTYDYQATAMDPDGDQVTYALGRGPDGMTIDPETGQIAWTPTDSQGGSHVVTILAGDGIGQATQSFVVTAAENRPPVIESMPVLTVTGGLTYRYAVRASDPEGGPVSYRLDQAPAGMRIDAVGQILWTTTAGDVGQHPVRVVVTDRHGAETGHPLFEVDVTPDGERPRVHLSYSSNLVDLGSEFRLYTLATDNIGVETLVLTVDGTPHPLGSDGTASIIFADSALYTVTVTATDAAGNVGEASVEVRVIDPNDTDAPSVRILSPGDSDVDATVEEPITYLTDIIGTVQADDLDYWRIEYARADLVDPSYFASDDPDYVIIGQGTEPVENAVLGTFDPTMLPNDIYIFRLIARDASGNINARGLIAGVSGEAKLGNFRLDFTDLSIPLAGIPIQITRTYDTLESSHEGDFGFGWRLGTQDADIRETVPDGATFTVGTRVFLTAPDGRRIGFTFDHVPQWSLFGDYLLPRFTPDPGVYATLSAPSAPLTLHPDGQYRVWLFGRTYNPQQYTLTMPDGAVYIYDQVAGLQTITDQNGNVVTFTKDGIFHSAGESIAFHRDPQGRIREIVDPAGNSIEYSYNTHGDLISVSDAADLTTRFVYRTDQPHFLDHVVDPLNRMAQRTEYDENGRITAVIDAAGNRTEQNFDPENFTGTTTDANGNVTTLVYNARGNVLEETDPLGNTMFYEYNDPRHPDLETRIINGRGMITDREYDDRGNVMKIVERGTLADPLPDPIETTFTYDAGNWVKSITNAQDHTTTFRYDSAGNLLEIVNAEGFSSTFTYDAEGRRKTFTDFNGHTTIFEHHEGCACGAPEKVIFADGTYQVFAYNAYGQVTLEEFYEADGTLVERRQTIYDAAGRVVEEITGVPGDPNHPPTVVRRVYDAHLLDYEVIVHPDSLDSSGQLLESPATPVDQRKSRITDFEYDAADRLIRQIDAEGGIVDFRYDAAGNRIALRDPVGNITTWVYDELNRVVEERDPLYWEELRARDAVFASLPDDDFLNLIALLDPSTVDDPLYDDPSGVDLEANIGADHVRATGYDAAGNRTEFMDRNGRRREFEYDHAGQLLEETWYAAETDALVETLTFTYDTLGNMLTAADSNSQYAFTYDTLNRLTSVDNNPDGTRDIPHVILTYAYDLQGNVTLTQDNFGVTVASTYDPRNRLQTRTWFDADDSGDVDDARVDFQYNAAGREALVTRYSNLAGTQVVGRTVRTYDLAGRSDLLRHDAPAGALLAGYDYDYDFSGLLIHEERSHQDPQYEQNIDYGYDLTGQLIDGLFSRQDDEHYEYDANGNRMFSRVGTDERTYTTGPANQLESDGQYRYEYDGEGNQIKRVNAKTGETRTLEYDHHNRLVRVEDWNSTTSGQGDSALNTTLTHMITYSYDPLGRRTESSADTFDDETVSTNRNVFVHDNDNVWIEINDQHSKAYHILGATIDDVLLRHASDGGSIWHLADRLRTSRDLTDRDGQLQHHAEFSTFGIMNEHYKLPDTTHYSYANREFDEATHKYNYRARYYDQSIARFMSPDPQLFGAGDPNLYRYVFNRPTAFTDPFGQVVFTEKTVVQRIQSAQAAVIRCLGHAAFSSLAEGGVYVLLTSIGNTTVGKSNVYIGKTKNFVLRFFQHADSRVGGRGLKVISEIPITLSQHVLNDPKKLRTVEQIFINAFGGKAQLLNKINASRKLFC